jgi:hypothetical protein
MHGGWYTAEFTSEFTSGFATQPTLKHGLYWLC